MDTRRVAMKRDEFVSTAVVQCEEGAVKAFVVGLNGVAHEELRSVLSCTTQIRVEGSAWKPPIAPNELASLSADDTALLIPIAKEDTMTCPSTRWQATDVKIQLYDADSAKIATLVVGYDREFLECTFSTTGNICICDDEIEFKGAVSASINALVAGASPDAESCFDSLSERSIDAWAPTPGSKWQSMPAWLACIFMKWAEEHLRLHVVGAASATLNADGFGPVQELFVDRATLTKVTVAGVEMRQLNCYLHKSTCGCFCLRHRPSNNEPPRPAFGDHSYTAIRLTFCGCKLDHRGVCHAHPARTTPQFQIDDAVACDVCTAGLSCKIVCSHLGIPSTSPGAKSFVSNVHLEQNPFATTLAATAVELAEVDSPFEAAQLRELVSEALGAALLNDDDLRDDVDIPQRDQVAEAIIRTGEYYYGKPSRSAKKRKLYERSAKSAAPKWMQDVAETHSHLFATK
jgi:hypothetical protein